MVELPWWGWGLMVLGYAGAIWIFSLCMQGSVRGEPPEPDEHRDASV